MGMAARRCLGSVRSLGGDDSPVVMKRLIVFDVDGTLTLTMELDAELYVEAVKQVLGVDGVSTDWSTYENITDAGVTAELIGRHFDRPAERPEIHAVRDRFVALMTSTLANSPGRCRSLPGASQILSTLRAHPRFECAVATGAWRASALLKLRCAGLTITGLPIATADDSPEREGILTTALTRAQEAYGRRAWTDVVLVGDGVWDLRAANAVGWRFLGVGRGAHALSLRQAGARRVIEDFTDVERVLTLLSERTDDA